MLFRRDAGHRLEPVGEVGRPLLHRPVLHRVRHHAGDVRIQVLAQLHRPFQRLIRLLGQPLPHHTVIEHHAAEQLGDFLRRHAAFFRHA